MTPLELEVLEVESNGPSKSYLREVPSNLRRVSSPWNLAALFLIFCYAVSSPKEQELSNPSVLDDDSDLKIFRNDGTILPKNSSNDGDTNEVSASTTSIINSATDLTMVHQLLIDSNNSEEVSSSMAPMEYILDSNEYVLVSYYAHWSDASQNTHFQVGQLMAGHDSTHGAYVAMVEIDCEVYQEYCRARNITVVPSLRFYHKNQREGSHLSDAHAHFFFQDAYKYATDLDILNNFDQYLVDVWESESTDYYNLDFGTPEATEGLAGMDKAYALTAPASFASSGSFAPDNLGKTTHEFLSEDEIPFAFNGSLPRDQNAFVFFSSSECRLCKDLQPLWNQLVQAGFHNVLLAQVDCSSTSPQPRNGASFCSVHGLDRYPSFFLLPKGSSEKDQWIEYIPDDHKNHPLSPLLRMRSFLAKQLSALDYDYPISVPSLYRPARPWTTKYAQDYGIVWTREDYHAAKYYQECVVMAFVYYPAPNHEIGNSFWSAWTEFSQNVTSSKGEKLLVAAVDCQDHDCPLEEDGKYFFVRWYHKGEDAWRELHWEANMTSQTLFHEKGLFAEHVEEVEEDEGSRERAPNKGIYNAGRCIGCPR